ncbi:MAG: 6-bladed beta-propeller [Candidatus Aminicenantes bacterium]|nr:6-bladed beta-propeller [Candidatus Aminicenantes bacterium]
MRKITVIFIMSALLCVNAVFAGNTIVLKSREILELINVSSFVMNSKGEMFLFSSRMSKIFKFKPDGSFEKSFCRKGEGPGEIIRVFEMYLNPVNDCLYLPEFFSMAKGKITIYDSSGNYKDLLKPELPLKYMDLVWDILFLKDSSYILVTHDRVNWKPAGKYFITQDEVLVKYFSPEGKLKSQVFKTYLDDELSNAVLWGGPTILFKPNLKLCITPDDQVAIAKTDENFISIYDTAGKKAPSINLGIPREKLSDKEFEIEKKMSVEYYKKYSEGRMVKLAENMIQLKYKPIYEEIFFTPDFIVLSKIIEEDESGYPRKSKLIFFDLQGKKKGEKVVNGKVMNRKGDKALIIEYDDEADEIYRVEPGVFTLKTGKK